MDDRRMLNVACQLMSGINWRLVQSTNCFALSAQNDIWNDECSGPLDANGGPELTTAQRRCLWRAIRLTRLGDPHNAELAMLRMFLRP